MSRLVVGDGLGIDWRRRLPLFSITTSGRQLLVAHRAGRGGDGRGGGLKCYLWSCCPNCRVVSVCCIALDTRSVTKEVCSATLVAEDMSAGRQSSCPQ